MKYLEIAAERKRSKEWIAVRDVEKYDNSGVQKYDMTNLPMKGVPDNAFDGVYSEHFIEHIFKYQGIDFFKEMLRVLKPGGIIRTVWPPYEFVEKLVSNKELEKHEKEFVDHYHQFYVVRHKFAPRGFKHKSKREQCALGLLYQNGENRCVWSIKEMKEALTELGYVDVQELSYMKSNLEAFNNIETNCRIRAAHSAIIEARKPKE